MSKAFLTKHKKVVLSLILLSLLILPAMWHLLKPGFFLSDDGEWMIIRFSAFYQTLREGQIPPRFFGRLNHEYGYPIGNFLYPGFMYLATVFKIIGLNFVDAIKSVFFFSILASGIGSFFWLKNYYSYVASFIGALVYVYFPYHIFDVYTRGSIGEVLGLGVLPFLLLAIDKKKIIPGSFLFGFLILSHNTLAFLLVPFLFLYTLIQKNNTLFFLYPLGLLLSAFFWVPSLFELSFTIFPRITVSEWNNYFLTEKNITLLGSIGIFLIGIACLNILFKRTNKQLFLFSVVYLLSIFFALSFSGFIWKMGILGKLAQFPWRFLLLSLWAGSFLAAAFVDSLKDRRQIVAVVLILVAVFTSALPYLTAYKPVQREEGYYATNEDTTTVKHEYMPVWVKQIPLERPTQRIEILKGETELRNISTNSHQVAFSADVKSDSTLQINSVFFPGWTADVNGRKTALSPNDQGYLSLHLPPGNYEVKTFFTETPLRFLADSISLATVLVLLLIMITNFIRPEFVDRSLKWYNKILWMRK